MSIGTQFSDSSNEVSVYLPYVMDYGHLFQNYTIGLSSTDEEYVISSYSPSIHMSYHIPYQMQKGFQTSTWENARFFIHGEVVGRSQEIYA